MTDALAPAVAEARAYVQAADKAHADETGWVEGRKEGRGHGAWLWVAAEACRLPRCCLSRGLLSSRTQHAPVNGYRK